MNRDIYNQNGHVEKVNPFHSSGFCVAFLIILAIAYWLFSFSYPYIRSLNWVKNTATITEIISRFEFKKHRSKSDHSRKPDTAKYKFKYSYEIGGNQYTGQSVKNINLMSEKFDLRHLENNEGSLKRHRNSVEKYEELLKRTSDIEKRQRIEKWIVDTKESIKRDEQEIKKVKDKLIRKDSKIEILVNPNDNNESMLFIDKKSVYYLIGIAALLYFYCIKYLLLIYAKSKFYYDEIKIENALSQYKLPLGLLSKKYWSTLSLGCCFLKPFVKVNKENKIHVSLSGVEAFALVSFSVLFMISCFILMSEMNEVLREYLFLVPTLPILELLLDIFVKRFPNADFDKDRNEFYYNIGRGGDKIVTALSDITALQILPVCRWNGSVVGYQLNIIFDPDNSDASRVKEYQRHYVLSYRKYDVVKKAAKKLSEFLEVPVVNVTETII